MKARVNTHLDDGDPLLTVKEVAQALRVDPTTVRRWLKNGSLAGLHFPYKVDGRQRQTHRIRRSVLDALLSQRYHVEGTP